MQDAKDILLTGFECWNAHDRQGFLAVYDENVVFFDAATGIEVTGREEFGKSFFDLWIKAYPDSELKEPFLFTDGVWVCLMAHFTGTHTGVYHGPDVDLPPTGKFVDSPYVFIAEVGEGKVKSCKIFYDRLIALEQEGFVSLKEFAAELAPA